MPPRHNTSSSRGNRSAHNRMMPGRTKEVNNGCSAVTAPEHVHSVPKKNREGSQNTQL